VTYKADVADHRETPALKVMELLQREGAALSYADPYTPSVVLEGRTYERVEITDAALASSDGVLILTAHSGFDYERIVRHAPLVFDTRGRTRNLRPARDNVVLL
jgi:UDP-N-acetyl-D-glucosamine dehydrogenase